GRPGAKQPGTALGFRRVGRNGRHGGCRPVTIRLVVRNLPRGVSGSGAAGNDLMREERDNLTGDQTIGEPYTLWGSVAGNVTAVKGAKFYVRGAIYGDLTVDPGGRCHVYGQVS